MWDEGVCMVIFDCLDWLNVFIFEVYVDLCDFFVELFYCGDIKVVVLCG